MSNSRKRPVTLTLERQGVFLDRLVTGDTVMQAAVTAGVDRTAFYRLRNENPEFAAAWDEALEHGTDLLEAEAQRRAVEGVEDFKVGPNGQFVEMRRYSDTLLIFLLKARRPGKYRDNVSVDHNVSLDANVVVEHQWRLTLDDLAAFAAQLRQGPQPRLSGELPAALPVLPAPEPD